MAGGAVEPDRLARVLERLRAAADSSGFLAFDRFQEIALYAKGIGYYDAPGRALGSAGDFYTAAHVSPLFGATVGDRVVAEFERIGRPRRFRVAELGPGDGTLARTVLETVAARLPDTTEFEYLLVERSRPLRERAMAALSASPSHDRVVVADSVGADGPFEGVVVANEVLDAQPHRRLVRHDGAFAELGVRWNGTRFVEAEGPYLPAPPSGIPENLPTGTVVELSAVAEALLREVGDQLDRGAAILLDYGADERDLLLGHPHGTLQAIQRHRALADPYAEPGAADLSLFVNFTRIRAAAARAGLRETAYGPQSEALARWGFEARFQGALAAAGGAEAEVRLRLATKNLLFGFENFRVLELAAGPPT